MDSFEAHSMLLLQDRYIVVVGGWGANNDNSVSLFDSRSLPVLRRMPCDTVGDSGAFKYGFSATVVDLETIILVM